jgi:hypothetical protein
MALLHLHFFIVYILSLQIDLSFLYVSFGVQEGDVIGFIFLQI